ncbi:MAG TPA: thiamine pyrophosphate-dependent dehydrogenase E1 component subunit alpha [Rhizomicrobium sp.]|nr:thiamine pyrophosphate-dependent dehydrogenase E1 component subunit alpha [Rhizomicrobium sp.]
MAETAQDKRLDFYEAMQRCALWEMRLLQMVEEGQVSGFYHSGRGQEGVQVGAVLALKPQDYLLYGHRGCGYQITRGVPLDAMFSDFLGHIEGPTRGLGAGTIHIASPELGILGQAGGVGGTYALAVGAALSARQRGTDQVALCMFGEGTANRGTFHEAANAAGVWKLPVVWLCENNGWAISASFRETTAAERIADRAIGYGMPGIVVDGQDPVAVNAAVSEAVERARNGGGPTLIEALTARLRGHYEGDAQRYRAKDEIETLKRERDPIVLLANVLLEEKLATQETLDGIQARVAQEVDAAAKRALQGTKPTRDRIFQYVYAEDHTP